MTTMTDPVDGKNGEAPCACSVGGGGGRRGGWIWAVLALAVVAVLLAKHSQRKPAPCDSGLCLLAAPMGAVATNVAPSAPRGKALPRLVDLGGAKCTTCKIMAPILEDLRKTCADTFDVQFIDVWENPEAGRSHGISVIPTQIFYDAAGKELGRHEGFMGRDDILARWKEYGVVLPAEEAVPGR